MVIMIMVIMIMVIIQLGFLQRHKVSSKTVQVAKYLEGGVPLTWNKRKMQLKINKRLTQWKQKISNCWKTTCPFALHVGSNIAIIIEDVDYWQYIHMRINNDIKMLKTRWVRHQRCEGRNKVDNENVSTLTGLTKWYDHCPCLLSVI